MSTGGIPRLVTPDAPEPKPTGALASSSAPRIVDSAELLLGQSMLLIRHLDAIYRLQATRQGKLILTK